MKSAGVGTRRSIRRRIGQASCLVAAFSIPTAAIAENWLGTISTDWFDTGNWDTNTLPVSTDTVTIDNNGVPRSPAITAAGAVGSVVLGSAVGLTGFLEVSGAGRLTGAVTLGDFGSGTMTISGGGQVSSTQSILANNGGTSGTVTVSGAGSLWAAGALFAAFDANTIASMTVSGGASMTAANIRLAGVSTTSQATLTITGTGTSLTATGMSVGEWGTATFNLLAGATANMGVTSVAGSVGPSSVVGNVTVSGASQWTTGNLVMGTTGTANVNVSGGSTITTTHQIAGSTAAMSGGTMNLTGAGTRWDIGGQYSVLAFTMGRTGATTVLNISDGAVMQIAQATTAVSAVSADARVAGTTNSISTLTISGSGSRFTQPYRLFLGGGTNSTGTINVANGGTLQTGASYISSGSDASDTTVDTVNVSGTDSVWLISNTFNTVAADGRGLTIGATGRGVVTLSSGGTLRFAANADNAGILLGGTGGSRGVLNIGAPAASPAAAPGFIDNSASIVFATIGGGTSSINFNHTATDYVFPTVISGSGPGTINVIAGTTILTANNSPTATVNISAGATLALGNGVLATGGLGSGTAAPIVNNGTLIFNRVDSANDAYGGLLSGSGVVIKRSNSDTVLSNASNAYTGGTNVEAGRLILGGLGSGSGVLVGNYVVSTGATLFFRRTTAQTYSGVISGGGNFVKDGTAGGILTLGATQTYAGSTTIQGGSIAINASDRLPTGTALTLGGGGLTLGGFNQTVGNFGSTSSANSTLAIGTGTFTAGGTLDRSILGPITGSGGLVKQGTGTWTITGTKAFTGTTTINAGTIIVGTATAGSMASSTFQVNSSGTLSGRGTVGATTVADGGALAQTSGFTLTLGSLALSNASNLNVALGAASNVALFNVTGALTADGRLNVTDAGGFGNGTYRLFDYGGALTNNGIVVASVPTGFNPGNWSIDTGTAGQINLIVAAGPNEQYWDGANLGPGAVADGRGGNGTWNASNTNWTNQGGTLNAAWVGQRAVFAGTPGTVSVVGAQMFTGLRFQNAAANWTYTLNTGAAGALRTDATGTEIEVVLSPAGMSSIALLAVPIIGSGSIVKTGGGQLSLAAANAYSGGTRVAAGLLNILATGALGSGQLVIDGPGAGVFVLSTLGAVSTGTTPIFVNEGELFFGSNTTSGSSPIEVNANGDAWFNEGSNAGSSAITVNAGGELFFRGANEARGAVVMAAAGGVVDISTVSQPGACDCVALGSLSGAGNVIIRSGTLATGTLGLNEEISGVISDSGAGTGGSLLKEGTGTLTLSGTSTYRGTTTIAGGTLLVSGSITASSALNVLNGGTLKGTGTLTATSVAPGGIHAPGASIGTQTVMGNYVLGGTLQVELNPVASDLVIVTGDVTLTGSTLDVMEQTQFGWQPNQSFTIIDNQGPNAVVGTFATVRNVYAFLAPTVSYTGGDGNNVVLRIARNQVSFPAAGLTPNQQAAGAGAESTGNTSPVYAALVVLPAVSVPAAFDQVSGEIHASIRASMLMDGRYLREAVIQRSHAIFEQDDKLGAWMQAYGAMERFGGDGNAAAISVGTGGLLFGGDGVGDNGWYVGVVGGIGRTSFSVTDRNSTGTADQAHIAAYATGNLGGVVLRVGAGVTQHNIVTTRSPAFEGFAETLTARYDATTAQVFGEAGYSIDVAGVTIEPFVGLAGMFQSTGGFSETGGVSALTVTGGSNSLVVASIGVRVSDTFVLGDGLEVEAFGGLAWRQAIGGTPTSTGSFAGGQPFTVASAPLNGGALTLELGAGIKLNDSARLDLSYSGQFSGGQTSHAAKATLHISF